MIPVAKSPLRNRLSQRETQGEVSGLWITTRYGVIIKLAINSKSKSTGDQLFLLEIEYAGLFHVEGVAQDQLHPFLLIECPRMIFPFLRRVVSDVTRDGGFPPLNLETIDFMALYRAELQRRVEAQKEASDAPTQ